ncbi:MAG: hypothetical protein ACRCSU_07860 [Paracoccaceae bacterium]
MFGPSLSLWQRKPAAAAPSGITYIGELTPGRTSLAGTVNQDLTSLSLQPGDLVIAFQAVFAGVSTVNCGVSDVGYTEIWNAASNSTGVDTNTSISWKIMGGTPDTSVTFNSNGSNGRANLMRVRAYRGVDQVTPILDAATGTAQINTNICNPPSKTTTENGALIVVYGAGAVNASEPNPYASSDLDDFVVEMMTSTTNNGGLGVGHKAMPAIGSFDPAAWTGPTDATTLSNGTAIFSLNPA